MRPAVYRYRLHADTPLEFSCGGSDWRLEFHGERQSHGLRCEIVGADRYTVATASDERALRLQLFDLGVDVPLNSFLCTLFLRLEQLGLAQRVADVEIGSRAA